MNNWNTENSQGQLFKNMHICLNLTCFLFNQERWFKKGKSPQVTQFSAGGVHCRNGLTLFCPLVCSPSIYSHYTVTTNMREINWHNLLLVLIQVRAEEGFTSFYIKSSFFHFWWRKMEMGNRKGKQEGEGKKEEKMEERQKMKSSLFCFSDSSDWL